MNNRVMIALGLIVVAVFSLTSLMPPGVKPVQLGDAAKPFTLPNLKGELHGLPEGKVVLLNFWATWCPPCRKEVPSMVDLYKKLEAKGFEIVAVSVDKRAEDVSRFVEEQKMNFTVLHDADSKISQQYGVFRYPETFIIDRDGIVRQHLNGAVEWGEPEFYDYIVKLLEQPVTVKVPETAPKDMAK